MTESRWPPVAALTGVLFFVLVVLAFIISGETPDVDDSPQKILDFYRDNDAEQQWAAFLLALGTVAFYFFLGVLRAALRAGEGAAGWLSSVAFGGGIVLGIGMLGFAGFSFTLGDAADKLSLDAAQTLNALNSDFFFPLAAGLATLMIATGLGGIRTRVLPAWLSWIALVIGIVAITPGGFFAFLAFGLWTLAASVVLYQGASATPAAPTSP
jgi:hypothetical protein